MAKFIFDGKPYKFVSMKVNGIECIVRSITGRFALEEEQLDLERELAVSDFKEAREVIACLMKK
jgi:hypothetical protein